MFKKEHTNIDKNILLGVIGYKIDEETLINKTILKKKKKKVYQVN